MGRSTRKPCVWPSKQTEPVNDFEKNAPIEQTNRCVQFEKKTNLEVYHYRKDDNGGQEVHQVGKILPVEGLTETADLVAAGGQQVEQGNHSAFKFRAYEIGKTNWVKIDKVFFEP